MQKEAHARIKINFLLDKAGWRFFDNEKGPANIVLEAGSKITIKEFNEFGKNFERTKNGYIDFLLLDKRGFPFIVLEAKSEEHNPLDGKEQARKYAHSQGVRFIILSNGNIHYFWDLEQGSPEIITNFPTPDSIKHREEYKPNPQRLASEEVTLDYIALSQNPDYMKDPRWDDEKTRKEYIKEKEYIILHPFQLEAVQSLQEVAGKGKMRYLFEMATGTGKTVISAAIMKLFLKTENAKRILFLVDRIELENQAQKSFRKFLSKDYQSVIFKENKDDWKKANIVVTTVQSLSFNNKYQKLFSPTDFDFIISDEAHRSINGNSRAVFEYFLGYKLGLTATPKDYLKNIDEKELSENDPRQWERRQLLDTYVTFGCGSGEPTFRYSLTDAVKDGFLVNPIVIDARTEITTELLSEHGYLITVEDEKGDTEEKTIKQKDFEKRFFSKKTNIEFCKTIIEKGLKDPISGEMGKTIIFCVSQNHASKITQILNQLADKYFPGKYNSDFALQITSNVYDAQQFTINFANNNLSGHTKFLEAYDTSKTRVCVTVGMMTTGYDCKDIINLAMLRPIFSPTDFIQMKGRGTRTWTFKYKQRGQNKDEETKIDKDKFLLFDFFANCQYFEEKFNYDEVIKLPVKVGTIFGGTEGPVGTPVNISKVESTIEDPMKSIKEIKIGPQGMKIDRKLFEKFEHEVKNDKKAKTYYEQGDLDSAEEYVRNEIFEKPEEYFNLEKIRKVIKADRRISLREIIQKIFGGISEFKSKNQLLEEEFDKFVSIYKPDSEKALSIKNFLKAYITDPEFRDIIDKNQVQRLSTYSGFSLSDMSELGKEWKKQIPEYVKDYVTLNTFM